MHLCQILVHNILIVGESICNYSFICRPWYAYVEASPSDILTGKFICGLVFISKNLQGTKKEQLDHTLDQPEYRPQQRWGERTDSRTFLTGKYFIMHKDSILHRRLLVAAQTCQPQYTCLSNKK